MVTLYPVLKTQMPSLSGLALRLVAFPADKDNSAMGEPYCQALVCADFCIASPPRTRHTQRSMELLHN